MMAESKEFNLPVVTKQARLEVAAEIRSGKSEEFFLDLKRENPQLASLILKFTTGMNDNARTVVQEQMVCLYMLLKYQGEIDKANHNGHQPDVTTTQ